MNENNNIDNDIHTFTSSSKKVVLEIVSKVLNESHKRYEIGELKSEIGGGTTYSKYWTNKQSL
jgi:hypothetical protein